MQEVPLMTTARTVTFIMTSKLEKARRAKLQAQVHLPPSGRWYQGGLQVVALVWPAYTLTTKPMLLEGRSQRPSVPGMVVAERKLRVHKWRYRSLDFVRTSSS